MEISSALSKIRQVVHTWTKFVINLLVINTFSNTDKVIYLTFDDGPCEKHTESIFNTLKELRVNAGFFFNGDAIVNNRELVHEMQSAGFFIGNHSYTHCKYSWRNWNEELSSIRKGGKIISSITGRNCKIYRPPFGAITPVAFLYLLIRKYKIIHWSVDSRDFEASTVNDIIDNICKVKSGDILLFHSDCSLTASNLNTILSVLSAKGYRFGNLSVALH